MRIALTAAAILVFGLAGTARAAGQQPVRLEVSNGNGMPGVAGELANWLEDPSFTIVRVSDAATFRYGQTFILYRPGMRRAAERLAEILPVNEVLRQTGVLADDIDIRLLLGRDFAHRAASLQNSSTRLEGTGRIEISNGNGVAGMASRLQAFLREQGARVVRLTNADSYDYERTVLYYREGRRAAAEKLAAVLPVVNIPMEESDVLPAVVDLRLVAGRDFISYDINKLQQEYASTDPS